MKILLPYQKFFGVTIHDEKVAGGIGRFEKLLYRNIPNVIPVEFTHEEQKKKQALPKIIHAALDNRVDCIITNYDTKNLSLNLLKQTGIPTVLISHMLARTIVNVNTLQFLPEFKRLGGKVGFVSEYQYSTWVKMNSRINPGFVLENDGLIHPSVCSGNESLNYTKEHDVIVVGRSDAVKDPFAVCSKLNKYAKKNGKLPFKVTIITTNTDNEYFKENSHWESEGHKILCNLPHERVLEEISKSRVLVSTCPVESFGINVLEALSHGVPCIVFTNKKKEHSSLGIPSDKRYCTPLVKGCSPDEFVDAVKYYFDHPEFYEDIYKSTQEKHSLEVWKSRIITLCEKAINSPRENNLKNFL